MTQLEALLLSLVVEVPLVVLATGAGANPSPRRRRTAAAFAATLLTHPFAWTASMALRPWMGWTARATAIEGAVILAEAALLAWTLGLPRGRALAVSAAANAASFTVGLAIAAARSG